MTSFSADLRKFAEASKRTMDETMKQVCLEIATRIVQRSPVDTGQFRGNWQLGDGGPDNRTDSPFDKQALGSPPSSETFTRWLDQLEGTRAGSIVYITNSLPYARRLEYEGYSKQAPAGMVRVTVVEYGQIISKVINSLEKAK